MLNTWRWLRWKEKDGEENRDKDEDGEEGEEMDRGEEGGLNHPPLRHKASPPITYLCRKTRKKQSWHAGCPVLEWINNAEHIDVDENEVEEEGRSKKWE